MDEKSAQMSVLERFEIMHKSILLKWGEEEIKVIVENRFCIKTMPFSAIHKHRYAEMHIIMAGSSEYYVNKTKYIMKEGMVLLIPAKAYHSLKPLEVNTTYVTFEIDMGCVEISSIQLSDALIKEFALEMQRDADRNEFSKVIPYMYLLLSYLFPQTVSAIEDNTDYSYLIYEFIDNHYNQDIHVRDLARYLNLSEKQTQRIVKHETGNSFLKELTAYRMKMANFLIHNTEMTLQEIAFYVGYQSYSGFWKVFKRYNTDKDLE